MRMEPPRPSAWLNPRGPLTQVGTICRNHGFDRDSPPEVEYRPRGMCDLTHRAAPSSVLDVGRFEPHCNRLDAAGQAGRCRRRARDRPRSRRRARSSGAARRSPRSARRRGAAPPAPGAAPRRRARTGRAKLATLASTRRARSRMRCSSPGSHCTAWGWPLMVTVTCGISPPARGRCARSRHPAAPPPHR